MNLYFIKFKQDNDGNNISKRVVVKASDPQEAINFAQNWTKIQKGGDNISYIEFEKFNFFQVEKILRLTQHQLDNDEGTQEEIKEGFINKLIEELSELAELHAIPDTPLHDKIEETYDVFNTAIGLLGIIHTNDENLFVITENISEDDESIPELNLPQMLRDLRYLNSYFHVGTNFESKTGMKDKSELNKVVIDLIQQTVVEILCNDDDFMINETYEMIDRKLNKWESKII